MHFFFSPFSPVYGKAHQKGHGRVMRTRPGDCEVRRVGLRVRLVDGDVFGLPRSPQDGMLSDTSSKRRQRDDEMGERKRLVARAKAICNVTHFALVRTGIHYNNIAFHRPRSLRVFTLYSGPRDRLESRCVPPSLRDRLRSTNGGK